MWKLVFFLPLMAMTAYIVIKGSEEEKAEQSQDEFRSYCVSLAKKMLLQEDENFDIGKYHIYFKEVDMSDPDNPSAIFKIENHKAKMRFEVRDGKIIRHHMIRKQKKHHNS